ncbi:unnamed protein product [Soboliphyme baturini]|uniref:Uncharacterized protein n=1 Tax=Soboliphyme baturini TaxID=241478 RepID=A0A183IJ27_9BILA|nr:unnamed protein product [Soboliphyme baturini]
MTGPIDRSMGRKKAPANGLVVLGRTGHCRLLLQSRTDVSGISIGIGIGVGIGIGISTAAAAAETSWQQFFQH